MKIVNKTPHDITIVGENERVFSRSEDPIRLEQTTEQVGEVDGIPLFSTNYGSGNMPEEKEGTFYIVSSLVAQAYPNRDDLLIVSETVRDKEGRIVGCRGLARNPYLN